MASSEFARFEIDDETYTVYQSDFTFSVMRHAKQWFGEPYGEYLTVLGKFLKGDADAVSLVVWIGMRKAGHAPPEPGRMDYAVPDILFAASQEEVEQDGVEAQEAASEGGNPTQTGVSSSDSEPTSTTSDPSTSSTSRTSARSARAK